MKRPVLAICAALGVLVLLGLGTWQVVRLAWKTDLIERAERLQAQAPRALIGGEPFEEYAPVIVSGGFVTDRTVHLNGTWAGKAGFYVFQPFKPDEGRQLVLVNRGFVSAGARQETYVLPDAPRLTALYRTFSEKGFMSVAPDPDGATVYDRTRATLTTPFTDLAQTVSVDGFAPYYLDSTLPTEVPLGGTTRLEFSNRHLGYAITWYGLAAGLIGVYIAMTRRR